MSTSLFINKERNLNYQYIYTICIKNSEGKGLLIKRGKEKKSRQIKAREKEYEILRPVQKAI